MKLAEHVRSLALWERVGVRECSGARRHFIIWGVSARPTVVSRGTIRLAITQPSLDHGQQVPRDVQTEGSV